MTAFSKVCKGKVSRRANKKDGNGPLNRQRDYNARLEALGFTRTDWNGWSYSWQGEFPTFTLAPGIVDDKAGLVAQCNQADKAILFPYGTFPADIKARLDDEILAIMRLQADAADPLSAEAIPFMGESYQPIIVEGQEIGPEIDF